MKIRPVGVELFHSDGETDGRTDVTNLRVACRTPADALKNGDIAEFVFLHFGSPIDERIGCSGGCFSPEVDLLRSHLLLHIHSTGLYEF